MTYNDKETAAPISCSDDSKDTQGPQSAIGMVIGIGFACFSLYIFLCGLQLLGESFEAIGGGGAGRIFNGLDNPIAGLMVGILATVLVQSSSTSTSIVVGLVGANQLTVSQSIPIIMGANIGTSVTNSIVSMGFVGDRVDLQRAFSAATVHDCFNVLSVVTLFPLELITGAFLPEGGILYTFTQALAESLMGGQAGGDLFDSPIKLITKPVQEFFLKNNANVIYALTIDVDGSPSQAVNETACQPLSSLSRLLQGIEQNLQDCSQYFCVSDVLDSSWARIDGYETLIQCQGYITDPPAPCAEEPHCYINGGEYDRNYVQQAPIIISGILAPLGDQLGGTVGLVIALVLLVAGLYMLTRTLHWLFSGSAKQCIVAATDLNDYLAMLVGLAMTIVAQSSSVVTSALVPFAALGLITLEKMLPLTLGSNIGTTCTALIAALSAFTLNAVHIALCHLFFNIFGILIWFPIPFIRGVVLFSARTLGLYAAEYRSAPLIYILVVFVAAPAVALLVSFLYEAMAVLGIILGVALVAGKIIFAVWWSTKGCYQVISEKRRQEINQELLEANAAMRGRSAAELTAV